MNSVIVSLVLTAITLAIFYIIFKNRLSVSSNQKKTLENIEGEIRSLVIEMNNTTDRNIALIEDRITELKELIEQADKRITLLKKDKVKDLARIKKSEPRVPINTASVVKKLSFREQVLDLHNKGFEAKVISRKLEANIGEVELILSLARGKQNE